MLETLFRFVPQLAAKDLLSKARIAYAIPLSGVLVYASVASKKAS